MSIQYTSAKGLCIFHDDTYHQVSESTVVKSFKDKVSKSDKNEALYCIGYHFPTIKFDNFTQPVYFNEAVFHGTADFSDGKFGKRISFHKSKFLRKAKFNNSTFCDEALFTEAEFKDKAIFTEAEFKSEAVFSQVKFHKIALFISSRFQKANFALAEFRETGFLVAADFHIAKFKGAVFIGTRFHNDVDFRMAEFEGAVFGVSKGAIFSLAKFEGTADFSQGRFHDVDFVQTRFQKQAAFTAARFQEQALFTESEFQEQALFTESEFQKEANFSQAKFVGEAEFNDVTFSNLTNFSDSLFCSIANFGRARFGDEVYFSGHLKDKSDFSYVLFENADKIVFDITDLSKASFLNTDVSQIKFAEGVVWGENENDKFKITEERRLERLFRYIFRWNSVPTNYEDNHRLRDFLSQEGLINRTENLQFVKDSKYMITVFDTASPDYTHFITLNNDKTKATLMDKNNNTLYEFIVEGKFRPTLYSMENFGNLGGIKAIYRNLRENFEYRMRYDEAGEFFTREMELKRKYREANSGLGVIVKRSSWIRRNLSITGFYRLASYGERIRMPIVFAVVVLSAAVLFWLLQFNHYSIVNISLSNEGLKSIGNATERSFATFLQLRNESLVWQDYIIKALGIVALGLFAIPLRRKFERKFRH